MKKVVIMAVCAGLVASLAQAAILSEDWETGTDGWVAYGAGPELPALDNTQNTTPGGQWSLRNADNAITNYTNALDYTIVGMTQTSWTAEWSFMDTGSTREYMQLQSYSGGGGSGTLQQLISFGTYNASPALPGFYNFRVAVGSVGWSNTTVARANNVWHAMKVEQIDNGNGTATLNFYVDGALGATANTTAVFPITRVRTGSGLTNGGHGVYWDDILITPEPAVGVLLGLGGLLFARRRRMA